LSKHILKTRHIGIARTDINRGIHGENNNAGKLPGRYKDGFITATGLTKELKLLEEKGWAGRYKGNRGKDYDKGLATLWFPAENLVEWMSAYEPDLTVTNFQGEPELLVLKSDCSEKKLEDYPDTGETQRIQHLLGKTNLARQQYRWSYHPLSSDGRQFIEDELRILPNWSLVCRRVFNGDFESGGRFYCAAQNLRKDERATLEIDSQPTVETDYKSLHPRMLYHMNGLEAPDDCYDPYRVKSKEQRQLTKMACMMAINSKSQVSAVKALAREAGLAYEDAEGVIATFVLEHSQISNEFYSESWKRLQFVDSQLVESVLVCCMEAEIPVLPIHDSFITTTQCSVKLLGFVKSAYRDLLGFDCRLDFGGQPDMSWLEQR